MASAWAIGAVVDRFSYTPVFVAAGLMPIAALLVVQWFLPHIAMTEARQPNQ
jgi:predicted MFS family arabinose efflux permease